MTELRSGTLPFVGVDVGVVNFSSAVMPATHQICDAKDHAGAQEIYMVTLTLPVPMPPGREAKEQSASRSAINRVPSVQGWTSES